MGAIPRKVKSGDIVPCAVCGRPFEAVTSLSRYCSKKCRYHAANHRRFLFKPEEERDRIKEAADRLLAAEPRPCKGCIWGQNGVCIMPSCKDGEKRKG